MSFEIDHELNKRIIEGATDGPWEYDEFSNVLKGGAEVTDVFMNSKDAQHIAHFNPAYMREYEARMIELEKALQKVVDDSEIGVVPRSRLDRIERLLNNEQ